MEIILTKSLGFCSGVERAVDIVETALEQWKSGIYVYHEIVHNKHVLEELREKGVIFVESIDNIPQGSTLVFPAHGTPQTLISQAKEMNLRVIDATCPLVKKIHHLAQRHSEQGTVVILIGHKDHDEIHGIVGNSGNAQIYVVENIKDISNIPTFAIDQKIVYLTQTTLNVDDIRDIIKELKSKFPTIIESPTVCYATTERQKATIKLVQVVDILIVIGSSNSSNSNRLREIGEKAKIPSYLINSYKEIKASWLHQKHKIGITSGASTPQNLIQSIVDYLCNTNNISSVSSLN